MSRPAKIPDILIEPMLELSAKGVNNTELAKWLGKEHNIIVNESMVCKRLKAIRDKRQLLTQTMYAEAAAASAVNELAIIDDVINRFHGEIKKALAEGDRAGASALSNAMHKYLTTHVSMSSGSDNSNNSNNVNEEDVLELLASKIKPAKNLDSN
jgi:hypothetical protein